jgi:ribosomal protein S18 acetylase RimI-like enzyme
MFMSTIKEDRKYIIREPKETDALNIIEYSKAVFASTDQLLTMPDEYMMTVEEEREWIANYAKNPNGIILIAEQNGRVIGLLDFAAKPKKKISHTGELGISVHPDFQRQGIGRALMETLLAWTRDNKQIEKVFLNVMETNNSAIALYKSLGFMDECRQKKAVKQPDGTYVDIIQMYTEVQ